MSHEEREGALRIRGIKMRRKCIIFFSITAAVSTGTKPPPRSESCKVKDCAIW
jgi:hypothetical protein